MAKEHKPYSLTSPCDNCPFRKDVKPFITPARVVEIQRSLVRSEFPCHKTTKHDDDGERIQGDHEKHCAGALILLEKIEQPSQMMRICERIGLYDRSKLKMSAPVYDSFEEMLAAHKATERKPKTCVSNQTKSSTSPPASAKRRHTRRRA